MSDVVTIRGFVASEVKLTLTESGLPVANFRLGSTERRFDRRRNQWVDAATNWYSVSMFRALAQNVSASVSKGERVIVSGKLKLRQWSKEDGRHGIAPEIDADAVGHDLVWGTAKFRRAVQTSQVLSEKPEPSEPSEPKAKQDYADGAATSAAQRTETETDGPLNETLLTEAGLFREEANQDSAELDSSPQRAEGEPADVGSQVHAPF